MAKQKLPPDQVYSLLFDVPGDGYDSEIDGLDGDSNLNSSDSEESIDGDLSSSGNENEVTQVQDLPGCDLVQGQQQVKRRGHGCGGGRSSQGRAMGSSTCIHASQVILGKKVDKTLPRFEGPTPVPTTILQPDA